MSSADSGFSRGLCEATAVPAAVAGRKERSSIVFRRCVSRHRVMLISKMLLHYGGRGVCMTRANGAIVDGLPLVPATSIRKGVKEARGVETMSSSRTSNASDACLAVHATGNKVMARGTCDGDAPLSHAVSASRVTGVEAWQRLLRRRGVA